MWSELVSYISVQWRQNIEFWPYISVVIGDRMLILFALHTSAEWS